MEQLNASKYRYDLDGLRGIAIAFVVLFHVFVGRVSGGVDVFLLLSGYFFLGAQLRYATREGANLNPWWPFWRTFRRLVPVLVVVLGATVLAVTLTTPELRNLNLATQLEACLGYYQNWALASQGAAYGAASNKVSPLQHLWSMAVQGQFYIFAITLATIVAIIARSLITAGKTASPRRLAGPTLLLTTVASFGYATYLHFIDQSLNYYSTFSRMWELTLGALLALFATHVQLNTTLQKICSWVGIILVLTTGFVMDGVQQFPGPATLYPLGGAALVVLGSGRGVNWLASRFMRWLGTIAYPLYLWHWPMLILVTVYYNKNQPSLIMGIIVIAVSLVLADLSHRLIEKPLQQHGKRPMAGEHRAIDALKQLKTSWAARFRLIGGILIAVLVFVVAYVPNIWREDVQKASELRLDPTLYPGAAAIGAARIPEVEPRPDPYLLADLVSPAWKDGCMAFLHDNPEEIVIDRYPEKCVYGDKDAEKLAYVVGGSHAEQWMIALDELGKAHHFRVIPIVRQSCPAFAEDRDDGFSPECAIFNQKMLERLRTDKPSLVITNSTRPLLERGSFLDEAPISYRTLWDFLVKENISFVGLRDNPWFLNPDGTGQMVSECWEETQDLQKCGRPKQDIYTPTDPAAQFLTAPNQVAVDTSKWFCPDNFCPPVIGNIYVYRDGNHMSDDYALTLVPLLWDKIKNVVESAPVREAERPATAKKNGYKTSGTVASPTGDVPPPAPVTSAIPPVGDYPRRLDNTNPSVGAPAATAPAPSNSAELQQLNDSLIP
ncbi:MAG: acyltransferase family protein [Corynebacterium sp.]|nr:acyltransferase family protein [Corynebacterium sp.]